VGSVRRLRGVAAVAGSLLVAAALIGATGGASSPPPDVPRYVALGDSLAVSYQPGGPSDQGYAERVWRQERRPLPSLALVKLGRGGETAASMNHSPRPGASQLERAEGVLRTTRTALVTIDIGCMLDGYNTDIARNFSIGDPDERCIRYLDATVTAVRQAPCQDVDAGGRTTC